MIWTWVRTNRVSFSGVGIQNVEGIGWVIMPISILRLGALLLWEKGIRNNWTDHLEGGTVEGAD